MRRRIALVGGCLLAACEATTAPEPPDVAFQQVATAYDHSCGITEDGAAYCWGSGAGGLLGTGNVNDSDVPVRTSRPLQFVSLSAGALHTCGLDHAGIVYCWGNNFRGQLGNGTHINLGDPQEITSGLRFMAISNGAFHSCAVSTTGAAYCWGAGGQGALGGGVEADVTVPRRVLTNEPLVAIAAGGFHTCGLRSTGEALCWGSNQHGQLGDGTVLNRSTPQPSAAGLRFTALAAGNLHTCGITLAAELYCWGGNPHGELGAVPPGSMAFSATPLRVHGVGSVSAVAAGVRTTCAVEAGGAARCWGHGTDGQLGDGSAVSRAGPTEAVASDVRFTSISTAITHACAVSGQGQIYCWGSGPKGQLGAGSVRVARSAVPIARSQS